jgi:hypothetical protein
MELELSRSRGVWRRPWHTRLSQNCPFRPLQIKRLMLLRTSRTTFAIGSLGLAGGALPLVVLTKVGAEPLEKR